jgi:Cu-Zn family superoxide dismutase
MSSIHTRTVVGLASALAILGGVAVSAGGASADEAWRASAVIVDASGAEIGFAKFVEDGDGSVHVNIKVAGLPAGKHGVHIHETGSCASSPGTFSGAGAHYNPLGAVHAEHAGDLPNLIVNEDLQGRLNAATTRVTLSEGATTVFDTTVDKVGSAIIIHANEDDFGPVANGNSGGRIACGVITGA